MLHNSSKEYGFSLGSCCLVFLNKKDLKTPITDEINAVRGAPKKITVPVVMTRDEVRMAVRKRKTGC